METRVLFGEHLVCCVPVHKSLLSVRSLCAQLLVVQSLEVTLTRRGDELVVTSCADVPILSDEPVTCELLSGRQLLLPAGLPVALAYHRIARELGERAEDIRLVYDCAEGAGVCHRKAQRIQDSDDFDMVSAGLGGSAAASCSSRGMCPLLQREPVRVVISSGAE